MDDKVDVCSFIDSLYDIFSLVVPALCVGDEGEAAWAFGDERGPVRCVGRIGKEVADVPLFVRGRGYSRTDARIGPLGRWLCENH